MSARDERIAALVGRFEERYGRRPCAVACAPGRVNLLGEHTDYNGLPVLPMAIERCILVAGGPRDDRRVELANVDPAFAPRSYRLEGSIPPFDAGDWGNYHKAAAQDLVSLLGPAALRGGEFLVDGDIPTAAGLSSSSALVVGSALALLAISGEQVPPALLAERLAAAERYVGTLSGGMDQAVCLLAEAGRALRIDFDPLRTRSVPVTGGFAFVVCDSLVAAEKSGAARAAYNQRVIECRLACRVLERALGTPAGSLAHFGAARRRFAERPLGEFLAELERRLPPRPLRLEEVAAIVALPAPELARSVGAEGAGRSTYALRPRARHVLTEAERVERGEAALRAGDWLGFGALMDASHASCREDYEVSSAALEALVAAAKGAGAAGARLTGAGFGGCTVNLVPDEEVAGFLARIEERYYRPRADGRGREHCFVFPPGAGASVIRL